MPLGSGKSQEDGGAASCVREMLWRSRLGKVLLLKAQRTKANDFQVLPEGEESDRPEGGVGSGEGRHKDGRFYGIR